MRMGKLTQNTKNNQLKENMIDIASISTRLTLSSNGIWYSAESENVSYPAGGSKACFSIEDNSFWFQHRNHCITTVISAFPPAENGTIFDIGGGNGFVSLHIANKGFNVALVEPSKSGAMHAKQRGIKNIICATSETAGFNYESLPAIGLFDVIEHIENDAEFLSAMYSLLKPGGNLYLTVPLYQALWSNEDKLAGHYRRYTTTSAKEVVKAAGFEIEYFSCFFRALPLPIYLLRALPYKLGLTKEATEASLKAHTKSSSLTHRLINAILKPELKQLRNKQQMRFGASLILVAKKPR